MKVLSIGTDKTVLDKGSVVNNRQLEYYKNFEMADVISFTPDREVNFSIGNINFISYGGGNRIVCMLRTLKNLRKKVKEEKYDLIYTQDVLYCGILGLILKSNSKSKLAVQIHGDYLDNPLWINQRLENRVLNIIGKIIVKRADKIRAVSNRIVDYCVKNLGVEKTKVVSLPIGIDGDIFNTNGVAEIRKKQIVFVGRLMQEKEPHFFCDIVIPILKKYPEFKVAMIGSGPLEMELKKRFSDENLEDRAEFPGFLKFADIAKYYKESFVFLHTAFWEGWGLPMVESTACGCPNVTTDTGCAGEAIIDGVNGIIIKTKIKEDYINAIEKLIQDEELYKKLVQGCLNSGNEWTFPVMTKKIEKFLIEAIK